jgi:1-deoxy-D-xylulose-5-phosphate synthase
MTKLLDNIDSPADLKGLDDEQLTQVAQEVRELIIDTIGEIGGHFGANLGACEIAVAIHSLLDSPRDKVLWDVGHQAYPHKVLTGRRDELHTIRKYQGPAPMTSCSDSCIAQKGASPWYLRIVWSSARRPVSTLCG